MLRDVEYRRLFEESRDAIYIGTVDGRLLDINPAGIALFEYENKEQMLALHMAQDLYWNPEERASIYEVFLAQGYVDEVELELKTRTGKRLRVLETATAMRDDGGTIVGFRGILRDVTEQRQLEEQLRHSQKMEAVGRLAGGVAHDFNNLLTAINGYSELALARMEQEDPMRLAMEEIRKAGMRAAELTRRLLTLSRHQMLSPRKISLDRVVADMEKLLTRVLGEDIELVTHATPSVWPIYADPGQLEQVLLNLAVNARDAMEEGGRLEIRVTNTEVAPTGDGAGTRHVVMTVSDTGIGMPREVQESIFDPFFSTKQTGGHSGLGLAIVYGIVKQNHGHIELDSREGQGSTFQVFLPAMAPEVDEAAAERPKANPRPTGHETVLLVEDEEAVRTLVGQILELHGYHVFSAADARQAEAICDDLEEAPDLLLTDVVMPGRSGPALAEALQHRYGDDLEILFMSGYTDSHTGVRLVTERRAAFLPKPFSPDALLAKVRQVLDGGI